MENIIAEVQITCIVLMGLMTFFLAGFLPRYSTNGRVLKHARILLTCGTFFICVHFITQYSLQRHITDVGGIRTLINLVYGFPMGFFCYMSYLYMQREGHIRKIEWLWAPSLLLAAIILIAGRYLHDKTSITDGSNSPYVALLYGASLLFYTFKLFHEHFHIVKALKKGEKLQLLPMIRWTKWSMFVFVAFGLGFPIITLVDNLMVRSVYGLLSLSSLFFYVLNFIGFDLKMGVKPEYSETPPLPEQFSKIGISKSSATNEAKWSEMYNAVDFFIQNGTYLRNGLTIKEAALSMGISVYQLRNWLHSTKYGKFSNWLTYLRIEKAKEMLMDSPHLSHEDIAGKCGFCDRQYFQLQFTKSEGMSPSKWVKTHSKNSEFQSNK